MQAMKNKDNKKQHQWVGSLQSKWWIFVKNYFKP